MTTAVQNQQQTEQSLIHKFVFSNNDRVEFGSVPSKNQCVQMVLLFLVFQSLDQNYRNVLAIVRDANMNMQNQVVLRSLSSNMKLLHHCFLIPQEHWPDYS